MAVVLKPVRHRREAGIRRASLAIIHLLGPASNPHPLNNAVRLVLAKIGPDPDLLRPHHLGCPRDHVAEAVQRAVGFILEMMRIKRESEHAT